MGLRGPKAQGQEDWMIPVAELMTKEHMSFTSACMALGKKFNSGIDESAARHSDAFQNVLDAISYKFYARIGDNPLLTKGVLAGVLMTAVRRLGEADAWEKVAVPGKLLADIMGWSDDTPDTPVIANLTQAEIDALRAKIDEQKRQQEEAPVTTQIVVIDGNPN